MEHNFFGHTATQRIGQLVEQFVAGHRVFVFVWDNHRVAQCPTARQNRDLGNRGRMVQSSSDQSVAAFVVGGDFSFVVIHQTSLLLWAGHHSVNGFIHGTIVDQVRVRARRQQGCLIEHIRQIRTRETGGALGQSVQINIYNQRLALSMNLQNFQAPLKRWSFDRYLTVETARTQQGRIQDVGTVGCSNQNDVRVLIETIHLDQQLVQCLFAFVISTTDTGATVTTNGVDLINKNDRRSVL